ncbi:MAG: cytochrome d ubiquinol oxidase subunit II [Deltaproteobacteria bacterium]|nr:cytochrome d ubiquinol oxidase subunit II [Deltaproteobacteria bacterium]TLN04518.1 MAG: cytochrome d ubiquinol oxidase subunit II [bacterium]
MDFQITWFVLWGVLWAVYFMLDGFVLGAGMLHRFLGKNDTDRRVIINTFGPVWDGNEVWLITAGGATFAAFPTTYALMFSYLYTALLLLLFSLIVRGVCFELRGKMESDSLKGVWDTTIVVASFLPALLFGVAFGNIFQGLPMDAAGYHGTFFSLLNPFGLLTGVLFVLLFMVHGALYLTVKTEGDLSARALATANRLWPVLLVVAAVFLIAVYPATRLYDNYLRVPLLLAVPLLAVASLLAIRINTAKGKLLTAFAASCLTILLVVATGIIGLFPNLIPSSLDPAASLTIYNSSSSQYTLKIMTAVALIFVPIVIAYKIWVYRVFRAKVTSQDVLEDEHSY